MARNNPSPNLIAEIDQLEKTLEARLEDFIAEDRALYPGLPPAVIRACILRGETNLLRAMRRIIAEREQEQERAA